MKTTAVSMALAILVCSATLYSQTPMDNSTKASPASETWGVFAEHTSSGNDLSCWVCTKATAGSAACLGAFLIDGTESATRAEAGKKACKLKNSGKCLEVQNFKCQSSASSQVAPRSGTFEWLFKTHLATGDLRKLILSLSVVVPIDAVFHGELLIQPKKSNTIRFATFEIVAKSKQQATIHIQNEAGNFPEISPGFVRVLAKGIVTPALPEQEITLHGLIAASRE